MGTTTMMLMIFLLLIAASPLHVFIRFCDVILHADYTRLYTYTQRADDSIIRIYAMIVADDDDDWQSERL